MNYAAEVEAAVATYSYYGYDSGVAWPFNGLSLAQVLTVKSNRTENCRSTLA